MLSWHQMLVRYSHIACVMWFVLFASYGHAARIGKKIELDNNGHKLHLTLYPPIDVHGKVSATIVLESGLGGGEWHWNALIEQLPPSVQIISYGRPGMDGSELDGVPPTPQHIANVLHTALAHIAAPPYLLVGHSWGGPLIRAFAGMFPHDVSGLVFVDPTDFNETVLGRREYVFGPLGHAEDGESIRAAIEQHYYAEAGKFDSSVQAEIDVSRKDRQNDFPDLKSLPMPQVPIAIVITTRYPKFNDPTLRVPFDQQKYRDLLLNYRILSLSMFARSVPEGALVTTPNSGHYIQSDEPKLISQEVNWVLHSSAEKH